MSTVSRPPLRRRPAFWVVVAVVAVPVLLVAWWLGRPLLFDDVVDESFPMSAGAVVPADMTQADVEAEMVAAAAQETAAAEAMPTAAPAMADGPAALTSGAFTGADDFHRGSGQATLYDLGDGSRTLRLEDFEVTNGPDLRVYLAPLDASGAPDVDAPGAVQLGRLKGNIGNQNYDVPAEFDASVPHGVVIYCQPFSVTFATAILQ